MAPGVDIVVASSEHDIDAIRTLWREYWRSLGFSVDFQNFETEVAGLPGVYAGPAGRLLLARMGGEPVGCVAFRPLRLDACEAKRMYVRAEFRGKGIGAALLNRLFDEARAAGYRDMYADTLPTMTAALRMYHDMGFVDVEPYSQDPTPHGVHLKISL
jgi:putative acetyltransferase